MPPLMGTGCHWRSCSPAASATMVPCSSRSWTTSVSRASVRGGPGRGARSEEHTSELQSRGHLVCRLLLEKKNTHHPIKITSTDKSPPTTNTIRQLPTTTQRRVSEYT